MKVIVSKKHNYPKYGHIHAILNFTSFLSPERRIDVWLPEDYNTDTPHAVLYMHDGQNLFNPALGFHGQIWAVDNAIQALLYQNSIKPTIIVGIWNTPLRYQEYLPAPAFNLLPAEYKLHLKGEHNNPDLEPLSDGYLAFIVKELKPYIDKNYSTLSGPEDTVIMGSSMGGLISAYALACYPQVFGGAGCLSTHWPLSLHEQNDLNFSSPYIHWLGKNLPKAGKHNLYFDFGTETIDKPYELHQQQMDQLMKKLGYTEGENWITVKDEGAAHNEEAWRNRVHLPIDFLLRKR